MVTLQHTHIMNTIESIQTRRSARHFNSDVVIPEKEITQLVELAMLTPTSYNIQHWKFVLVDDPTLRSSIRADSYDQAQVTDASALILVVADIKAWEKGMRDKWKNVAKEIGDFMASSAAQFYEGREQIQRDEAIRSASLATQTLALAATAMGYDSGIMIGFEFDKVAELINLPENYVISSFVVIGESIQDASPRGGQLPISETLIKNKF